MSPDCPPSAANPTPWRICAVGCSVSCVLRVRRLRAADFFVFAEILARDVSLVLRAGLVALVVFFLRFGFFLAMPKSSTGRIEAAKGFVTAAGWVKYSYPASEYSREGAPRDSTAKEQD